MRRDLPFKLLLFALLVVTLLAISACVVASAPSTSPEFSESDTIEDSKPSNPTDDEDADPVTVPASAAEPESSSAIVMSAT